MSTPDLGQPGAQPGNLSDAEWQASLPSWGEPVRMFSAPAVPPSAPTAPTAALPVFTTTPPAFSTAPPAFGSVPRTTSAAQSMYRGWTPSPSSANTAAVWWIIFLPFVSALALVGVLLAMLNIDAAGLARDYFATGSARPLSDYSAVSLQWYAFTYAISLATFAATVWLAYRDRSALLAQGHAHSASPWWLLLHTLIYLLVRHHHVRPHKGSASPVVVYALVYIAPGVLALIGMIILAIVIPLLLR